MSERWTEELAAAITVCDAEGRIVEMNAESARTFAEDGGRALLGRNVLDCHPEPARRKLEELLVTRETNVYTIEKNGRKKLVYQAPWFGRGSSEASSSWSCRSPSRSRTSSGAEAPAVAELLAAAGRGRARRGNERPSGDV